MSEQEIKEILAKGKIEILKGEEFRTIIGYEEYLISNFGRVVSTNYRRMKGVKLMKHSFTQKGYPKIKLKGKTLLVARLVYITFNPEKENEVFLLGFKDGNHQNINLNNLYEME